MPVYVLVRAKEAWNPENPTWDSGYLVHVRDRDQLVDNGVNMQLPPDFCQIKITDVDDPLSIESVYCREWTRAIDWEFVLPHDWVNDVHTLNIFIKPDKVAASGVAGITRDMVETYLNKWNATVDTVSSNSVVFNAGVYTAIQSRGFWGKDTSLLLFDERSYDSATGVHRVDCDYRNDPVISARSRAAINAYIEAKGGTIVGHNSTGVRFDINRDSVFQEFKLDVKETVGDYFSSRQFRILPAQVAQALANGGTLEVTQSQFITQVRNRLDD